MRISDWSSDVCSSDLCHISGSDQRVRQTRGDFLQRFTAAADEGELRPLTCQSAGYGGTDTSAAASDERMMALEAHHALSAASCSAARWRLRASWAWPPR